MQHGWRENRVGPRQANGKKNHGVSGGNSDYSFEVDRTPEGRFSLFGFSPKPDLKITGAERPLNGYKFCGLETRELFNGSAHVSDVVISGKPSPKGEQLLVSFNRMFPSAMRVPQPGWVLLDPKNHYAILCYEQWYSWGAIRGWVEYQPVPIAAAFPRVIAEDTVNGKTGMTSTHDVFTLGIPNSGQEVDPSRFRLPAFGLTEPVGTPRGESELTGTVGMVASKATAKPGHRWPVYAASALVGAVLVLFGGRRYLVKRRHV